MLIIKLNIIIYKFCQPLCVHQCLVEIMAHVLEMLQFTYVYVKISTTGTTVRYVSIQNNMRVKENSCLL